MTLSFQSKEHDSDRIQRSVMQILESVSLCSIATIGGPNQAHINTAFLVYTDYLTFYFWSDPRTQHCRNIHLNGRAAMCVFDSNQTWGEPLAGLQFFGMAQRTRGEEEDQAGRWYAKRFPRYKGFLDSLKENERLALVSRFYRFTPDRLKVLMDREFGEEVYVEARIHRLGSNG